MSPTQEAFKALAEVWMALYALVVLWVLVWVCHKHYQWRESKRRMWRELQNLK